MAQLAKNASQRHSLPLIPSSATLAFWQLRQSWRLLLIIAIGMIAAIVLVCALPLFSQIALSAGLRTSLAATSGGTYVTIHNGAPYVSAASVEQTSKQIANTIGQDTGKYFTTPPLLVVQTQAAPLLPAKNIFPGNQVELSGYDTNVIKPHLTLLQGQLPQDNSKVVQVALTADDASYLHATIGSVLTIGSQPTPALSLQLHVVGIFKPTTPASAFWHGDPFARETLKQGALLKMLVSQNQLLAVLGKIQPPPDTSDPRALPSTFYIHPDLFWYYSLDTARLDANQVDDLIAGLVSLEKDLPDQASVIPPIGSSFGATPPDITAPTTTVEQYRDRIAVARLPTAILSLLVFGLIVFFLCLMVELLIDHQSSTIALLRSRGASRRQVFSIFALQTIVIGLIALFVAPLLALPTVRFLVQKTLPASAQGALNLLSGNPLQLAWSLRWYIGAALACTLIAMIFSIYRATAFDVLAMRREATRSQRRPFWQRFYLDMLSALVAATGVGFLAYISNAGVLDARLQVLVVSPLILAISIFSLLAATLFFLRIFPFLLRFGTWLATRNRGVVPMLALAQMARSPRQALRMTLLLALATAFAAFTLIFTASQAQHTRDVAAYQAAADFSGGIADAANAGSPIASRSPAAILATYRSLPGVTAASVGLKSFGYTSRQSQLDTPIKIMAVNSDTFAGATDWPEESSPQALSAPMRQLAAQRSTFAKLQPGQPVPANLDRVAVPAIVDAATWDLFHLSVGKHFNMTVNPNVNPGVMSFVAVARVPHIPSINDSVPASENGEQGVLVDYQSYAAVYAFISRTKDVQLNANYVWLKTSDDTTSLGTVRAALNQGTLRLDPLFDRRAIATALNNDPLFLNLIGVLALGASAPVLLALICNLLASWLTAHHRLTNFTVLRALGTTQPQVVGVLTWEQAIIYITALVLGTAFGLLLSAISLPGLVFSNLPTANGPNVSAGPGIYALQNVPPLQMVLPTTLLLALAALAVICLLALALMARITTHAATNRILRLNED